ncbi:MAG: nucleotidyltransferase domain-containing protein [Microlunatus sp.]|nr:nucleotidyltransferase domain-containing protein [Microlunatus sp.]
MPQQRTKDQVRQRLLDLAAGDPVIMGAAITGSTATGSADEWSDLDLALGVGDHELTAALERWTRTMIDEFGAVHHWDLPAGDWVYRVFLLPDLLEVDLGFAPAAHWGPLASSWQTIFGAPLEQDPTPATVDVRTWTGHLWHHLLHTRAAIERRRGLQAAYWIGAARELLIESACRRFGLPVAYAKGAHRLPPESVAALEATLVGSTAEPDLRRALAALTDVAAEELALADPAAAGPLRPVLEQLRGPVEP